MARKSYYEILRGLAPESTGNHPIVVSMPFLFYHLGKYHVVSIVTGGQSEGRFVRDNRDAGRIVGIAFYHPDEGTGEYLTPARAKEKFGLDLLKYVGRSSAKLGKEQADDETILPKKLDENIAEKLIGKRTDIKTYNQHVMLAAALSPNDGKRYLYFKLNPDDVPAVSNSSYRRKLFAYRVFIVIMIICFFMISRGFTAYHDRIVELEGVNSALLAERDDLKSHTFDLDVKDTMSIDRYQFNQIIEADIYDGSIGDHVRGKRDSKVIVIAYLDFQCPGCASAWPILEQLYQEYGDRVAFVQRNYPLSFHAHARIAARAAEAASRQGYYWQMVDTLFEYQSVWSDLSGEKLNDAMQEMFKSVAPEGNLSQFVSAIEGDDVYRKVSFDYILGSAAHEVGYTPTIIVNGEKVDFSEENTDVYALTKSAIQKGLNQ